MKKAKNWYQPCPNKDCSQYGNNREKVHNTTKPFKQIWKQKTPGMAAGLTDHVWTFRELLTFKFAHAP